MSKSTADRFWEKVDVRGPDDCWLWKASTTWNDYGQFVVNSKTVRAHRFSWELANSAPVPDGMNVLHKCGNIKCVNPNHLGLGDDADVTEGRVERSGQPR